MPDNERQSRNLLLPVLAVLSSPLAKKKAVQLARLKPLESGIRNLKMCEGDQMIADEGEGGVGTWGLAEGSVQRVLKRSALFELTCVRMSLNFFSFLASCGAHIETIILEVMQTGWHINGLNISHKVGTDGLWY